MLATTPGVPVADFQSLAASCVEMQVGAGQMLQPVAVQMFRVLVNTEGVAQAGAMFPGGGGGDDGGNLLDPLQPLPPAPSPPPDATGGGGVTGVTQYHAECTSADVASCVPPCNAEHHGFELLATIDGTDTKFSCNLAHGLYSWMGVASEGGYLGADAQSFVSAVVSGVAGMYIVTLTADAGISTDVIIQPGQDVRISGDPGLAVPPSWGSGGFTVAWRGSLSLTNVQIQRVGDPRVGVTNGGSLSLTHMAVPLAVLYTPLALGGHGGVLGPNSRLVLEAVTVTEAHSWCIEHLQWGALTGTMTVGGGDPLVIVLDPPDLFDNVVACCSATLGAANCNM